jgi:hypothetical protein
VSGAAAREERECACRESHDSECGRLGHSPDSVVEASARPAMLTRNPTDSATRRDPMDQT